MMRRLVLLASLFVSYAALAADLPADDQVAWFKRGGGGVVGCPVTATQTLDGCLGAPAYTNATLNYQDASLMTAGVGKFFQSGQAMTGVTSPGFTYNVTGKDFAVGVDMSKGQFANVSVTNSNSQVVVVPHSFCNNTANYPCTVTPGAEGLIDGALYHWNTDPAGFGCSASSTITTGTTYQIACVVGGTTAVVDINGVDFQPNGQCYTVYVQDSARSVNGSVTIENFRWKNQSTVIGSAGCTNPLQGFSFKVQQPTLVSSPVSDVVIKNFMVDQNAGFEPSGAGAVVNYPRLTQTNYVFSLAATRDGIMQYGTCDNLASRCAAISTCGSMQEIALESSQIGWWPAGVHAEYSINLPARNLDSTCLPSQKFYNHTARTDLSTANSADATAPVSTSEPTNTAISGASYDAGTGNLTFSVAAGTTLGSTFATGLWMQFLQNTSANSLYVGFAQIVSVTGTGPYTVVVHLPSTTGGAGFPAVASAANYTDLDVEYNTLASNHPGGLSPYYVLAQPSLPTTPSSPTLGQSGQYAVGDILSVLPGILPGNSGAQACASPPLVYVSAVNGSFLATTILGWDGGKCALTYPSSTLYATTCVSSIAAGGCAGTGLGTGAEVKATYGNATAGDGIQPNGTVLGTYTMAHNRIDSTAFANLILNLNNCPGGQGVYTDNYTLDAGAKIVASASGSGCKSSF